MILAPGERGEGFALLLRRCAAGGAACPAILMGIVNVTPDSFSDGGLFAQSAAAVAHGRAMAADGAAILDIGGESTRPSAQHVNLDEEAARVLPVIGGLAGTALLSIDTTKAEVADAALAAGAHIVNDIRGLQGDPAMADVAAQHGAGVIAMHNPGLLGSSSGTEGDPVAACLRFFEISIGIASRAGIKEDRLVLDPGFGFGKTVEQSLELLRRLPELVRFGFPIMVGTSRKSFIGKLLDREVSNRLAGTLATHVAATLAGAAILRVHDVAPHRDAVLMAAAIRSGGYPHLVNAQSSP